MSLILTQYIFLLCPRRLDRSFCSGNMPGISSVCYPSFPIRGRPEVCAGQADLAFSSAFLDGLTEAGIKGIRFPSGKQTKAFQGGTARVPTQQRCLLKILATKTKLQYLWILLASGFCSSKVVNHSFRD